MTVAEATTEIKLLRNMADMMKDNRMVEALDMAIISLEAWDKVINTLKNWSDAKVSPKQRDVYFDCIELIEQTMKQEVTNDA